MLYFDGDELLGASTRDLKPFQQLHPVGVPTVQRILSIILAGGNGRIILVHRRTDWPQGPR